MNINTKEELLRKLKALGSMPKEQRNSVVCSLIGHSRIQTNCWGHFSCARCGDQLGDSLASVYMGAETAVIVGHNCWKCRANFRKCTWRDKVFAPNPFPKGTKHRRGTM